MIRTLGVWRALALLLLAIAAFNPGRATLPPVDRDEPRYAEAAMQMIETGDYLDVRFLDQPRYLQPAGIYWLQAAAVRLFGDPSAHRIGAHRLVSLAGAVLSVLLTGWIGARLFSRNAGFAAGILLAATTLLGFESHIATIDATLLCAILTGQAALATVYLGRGSVAPPSRLPAAVFWLALGCGTMLKGPVPALVLFGTLAALAVTERRTAWMRALYPAWGVPLALLLVLPWLIAIGIVSHGEFFARSVGQNFLGKVASGQQAHGAPPGYYLALFPAIFGPGSILAVLAAPAVWARRREPAVRFCLCWIAPTWIVFEAVTTKLPHYVLPTYPAIAILAATAIIAPRPAAARPWQRRVFTLFAAVWLGGGTLAAFAPPALLWWTQGTVSPLSLVLSALIAAALWLIVADIRAGHLARGRPAAALAAVAVVAVLASANAYALVLPHVTVMWIAPRVAALVGEVRPCAKMAVVSASFSEPSLGYLLGAQTRMAAPVAAANRLVAEPACTLALVAEGADEAAFRARLAETRFSPQALGTTEGANWVRGTKLRRLMLFSAAETQK